MKLTSKGIMAFALALLLTFSCVFAVVMALPDGEETAKKAAAQALKTAEFNADCKGGAKDDEVIDIFVKLTDEEAALSVYSLNAATRSNDLQQYQQKLLSSQKDALSSIRQATNNEDITPIENYTLLFNGFAIQGEAGLIDTINAIPGMTAFRAPSYGTPEINMSASTELVGATEAWDLGYTGKGMTIAILDTGILSSHEAFSVAPDVCKLSVDTLDETIAKYGEFMHCGTDSAKLYKSAKIPFGWDYKYEVYEPAHTTSDHGTHVAGISAGNNGKDFKGVAYDAQLVVMQVFAKEGGTSTVHQLAALEDCAYIGVDAVNMSFGAPAGYSEYAVEEFNKIYELLDENGVNVSASAGNEGTTADSNAWGGYQLTSNPDLGLVGQPSTYAGPVSVASSSNASISKASVVVGDSEFGIKDPKTGTELAFEKIAGEYEYVLCGLGTPNDFQGLDLTGKIAAISRGSNTFTEKAANAIKAGATGIIVYNNQAGVINMSVETTIPICSVLQPYGQILIDNAKNNVGKLTIKRGQYIDMAGANLMSDFSSRGTTADLLIKPEITAPGGAITSSVGFEGNAAYGTWDGTSMSSPHVAAGMAVIKQYVRENFPNASAYEVKELVNAILMSTATPIEGSSVRAQGAGLMNLLGATTTKAYLSVENCSRPKLELGENENGEWTFKVTVHNFGTSEQVYTVKPVVTVDKPFSAGTYGDYTIYVTNEVSMDITEDMDITAPETVTVKAGQSATVEITLKATQDVKDFMKQYYPSGMFLEGFVEFVPSENSDDVQLSVPFLGFCGDWDYASVLDRGYYWQEATGDYNWNSNGTIGFNYAGSNGGDGVAVGLNMYVDNMDGVTFNPDWGAVSPNGDHLNDYVNYMRFGLLRNASKVYLKLIMPDGEERIVYESEDKAWRKDFLYNGAYTYCDLSFNLDLNGLEEGQTATLMLETWLDHEGYSPENNESGQWKIPITLDTTAPVVNVHDGKIDVTDSHYLAYTGIYKDATFTELASETSAQGIYDTERGKTTTLEGLTGKVYLFVGDYAGNGQAYAVDMTQNTATPLDVNPFIVTETPDPVVLWQENWEDESTYDDWNTIDNDGDSKDWSIFTNTEYAYEGDKWAGSMSYDETAGDLTPDNWLISKAIDIPDDGNTYKISFHAATTGSDEAFELLICDGDSLDTADYTAVITEKPFTEGEYKLFEYELAGYEGRTVRFAWRHTGVKGGYCLRLDNLSVYTIPEEAYYGVELLSESFENSLENWTLVDVDNDGYNWAVTKDLTSVDGNGVMYSNSFVNDVGAVAPDNWAISAEFTIPESAKGATLSYYAGASDPEYYWEKYTVYAGTGTNPENFNPLFSERMTDSQWHHRTVDLTAFVGKTISIAFRHHQSSDAYVIMIDKVQICYTDPSDVYNLTYYVDGEVYATHQYCAGEPIEPMEAPTHDTLVFSGWSYIPETMPQKDVNVYGTFNAESYTVKFVDGVTNDVIKTMKNVPVGTVITDFPETPAHEGYVFKAWDYDGTPIATDTTITATYIEGIGTPGDVNSDGKIDSGDALIILCHLVNVQAMTEQQYALADMNRDSLVNTGDVSSIMQYAVSHTDSVINAIPFEHIGSART